MGKIRVYDLFGAADVERFVEEGEPEQPERASAATSAEGTR